MSTKREIAVDTNNNMTAPKSAATDTPPTDGTIDVAQVLALIGQIEAVIPGFAHHDTNDAKRVANVARIGKDLIPQIIATITALPSVGGVNTFDAVEGKDSLTFEADMQPVVQRLSALLTGTVFTVNSRIARSASRALSTYAWAKNHAKGPEGIEIRPFVDDMTSTMKKTLNRRKPAKPAPTPAPAGAQGFLAPNLAAAKLDDDDYDLPEDFRKEMEEALKD